jgi:peroxiredoxin Q/BCP
MLGKKVADFSAVATGGAFRLSDHRGKTVVLYFYNSASSSRSSR